MKNKIVKEFQTLINGVSATRPTGWQFKIGMYRKAQKAFKNANNVRSKNEARAILLTKFKNPESMLEKIAQLFNKGHMNAVSKFNEDPQISAIKLLSSVPHIGIVKARKLVQDHSIKTVNELKQKTNLLNGQQQLGLKYYNQLINKNTLNAKRIPRNEIEHFEKKFANIVKKYGMTYTITGSYRRGAKSSGDIDILLTGSKNNMPQLIDELKSLNILAEHFSYGAKKWMGIGILDKLPRRVDIMYTPRSTYAFALLYFTGSQEFNEQMRGYARKKGYTLNEHRIENLDSKETKLNKTFEKEEDIFNFLEIPYIIPENRNEGKFSFPVISVKLPSSVKQNRNVGSVVYNVSKGVTLADVYKPEKHNPIGMFMSEKYDGERAVWNGRELRSRTNKKIYAPEWFIQNFPKDYALDGELFTTRGGFQKTMSIVKKYEPIHSEWKYVSFKVFDIPNISEPYEQRYIKLKTIVDNICATMCHIDYVRQIKVTSKEEMNKMYKQVLEKGGEGLMLRSASMMYTPKRTKDLLKVKPIEDSEAIITNMTEGTGKDSGRMGALVVHLKNNVSKKFKIGTGFTDALRQNFWNKKNSYIGKTVTFTHKGLTNAGKPRHAAYLRLRNNNVQ